MASYEVVVVRSIDTFVASSLQVLAVLQISGVLQMLYKHDIVTLSDTGTVRSSSGTEHAVILPVIRFPIPLIQVTRPMLSM